LPATPVPVAFGRDNPEVQAEILLAVLWPAVHVIGESVRSWPHIRRCKPGSRRVGLPDTSALGLLGYHVG